LSRLPKADIAPLRSAPFQGACLSRYDALS
jgi:hypothetical protein